MSETDYNKIKQDLKDYFRNKTEFTDYDFDGSALSTLIEILAYNSQNLALQSNLTFSETFLDSANQRASIVSRAKELGYIPRSMTSSKASIEVSFNVTGNPLQYTIPQGTTFSSAGDSKTYNFITTEDILVDNDSNDFYKTIEIVQGRISNYTYTVNSLDLNQKFIVPSKNVDVDYLQVSVNGITYSKNTEYNIGEIKEDSTIYYIFENIDGYYEIYFGDDVLGKSVSNGDSIYLEFLITDGSDANYLRKFTLSSILPNITNLSITTIDYSQGGASKESIDSVKFNSPLSYQAQNRAVTKYDYISLIKNNVSGVEDVTVWGGEENDPPYYGKVFIALKPYEGKYISNVFKERIKTLLKTNFSLLSIRPEIVDPDYIDVGVEVVSTYSGKTYSSSLGSVLNTTIQNSIVSFFDSYDNKFGEPIYYSTLLKAIQNSDSAILNVIMNFNLTKYNKIYAGTAGTYIFNFNNYITPETIRSTSFNIGGNGWIIKDVPLGNYPYTTGKLVVYRVVDGSDVYYSQDSGTVDYATGTIAVSNLKIDSATNNEISITINPGSYIDNDTVFSDYNVYTNKRDQIIRLDESKISITLLPDNTR